MDKYRIDSHKLLYHVSRVSDWLKGENIVTIQRNLLNYGAQNVTRSQTGVWERVVLISRGILTFNKVVL